MPTDWALHPFIHDSPTQTQNQNQNQNQTSLLAIMTLFQITKATGNRNWKLKWENRHLRSIWRRGSTIFLCSHWESPMVAMAQFNQTRVSVGSGFFFSFFFFNIDAKRSLMNSMGEQRKSKWIGCPFVRNPNSYSLLNWLHNIILWFAVPRG